MDLSFAERDHVLFVGDNRETLADVPDGIAQMLATSPPYFGLRLYGDDGAEIGKERDLDAYVASIVDVMRVCRDKLRDDGTAWVNLGDSYASAGCGPQGDSPAARPKNTDERASTGRIAKRIEGVPDGNALLVPFRVAAALQADGWTLRAMLPWIKLASMPESVQSRPCIAHEYVLFLTKRPSGYFYDADAVRVAHCDAVERAYSRALARGTAGMGKGRKGTSPDRNDGKDGPAGVDHNAAINPAGRSLRSSDIWRAGAREAGAALLAAAEGEAVGMLTNDDAPAAFVVNPKGSGIPHFAMWPTRLVAPMVMAGTPEAGCCSVCGAPWMRVVERKSVRQQMAELGVTYQPRDGYEEVNPFFEGRGSNQGTVSSKSSGLGAKGDHQRTKVTTLGFRPSCDHDAPAVPAVVLDPFAGACTTLGVASALGRRSIGCELYQKNADLAPQRIDIVRTEMVEYLREIGDTKRAGDVVLAQRQARHEGIVADAGPLFAR